MIFPRYHQLDSVRKLVARAREDGVGQNYLIQHSAGSGETNSISWLSHRLASLHEDQDAKVYECVVVITDRQMLDRQLQDAICQIEHFRRKVKHLMGGRAKAMVVTSSRLHAVRYMLAFEKYIAENGYDDVRPLVAFSGTVKDPESGLEFTEPGMNTDVVTGRSISESQLPERFDSDDHQILLVANKYQTGFDQPLLQTMYVGKRLLAG